LYRSLEEDDDELVEELLDDGVEEVGRELEELPGELLKELEYEE
jgi:hypothetical protein